MLRRVPLASAAPSRSGDPVTLTMTGGGFGIISKPFKVPTSARPPTHRGTTDEPARKRRRISYKEDGQADDKENDPDASDGEGGVAGKRKGSSYKMGNKEYDEHGVLGGMAKFCKRKFPKFEVKAKEVVFGRKWVAGRDFSPRGRANAHITPARQLLDPGDEDGRL